MNNNRTIPMLSEPVKLGDYVPGTIGFDFYLFALGCSRDAVKAPRVFRVCNFQ